MAHVTSVCTYAVVYASRWQALSKSDTMGEQE